MTTGSSILNFSDTVPVGIYNINILTGKKNSNNNYYGYYTNTYSANTYTLTVNAVTAPGAPTSVTASAISSTSATVSFIAPDNNGGSPITSYTATSNTGGKTGTVTQSGRTITVSGLTPGTAYTFTVIATNIVENSSPSVASGSITIPPTVPGAPTIGPATLTSSTSATVSFTPPDSNGGSPIISYIATSGDGSISGKISQFGNGTIPVSGLTPGTSYTFNVTAENSVGFGKPSGYSNIIITPLVNSLFLQQTSPTSLIQYSFNDSNWNDIPSWPFTINNSNTNNTLIVKFNTALYFKSTYGNKKGYFIIGSNNITINGNNKIVNINNITGYPGLFQNGDSSITPSKIKITIENLGVTVNGNSSLISVKPNGLYGGWVCQAYFGAYAPSDNITVNYCYSNGPIAKNGGGILGANAGKLSSAYIEVNNCYSNGSIASNGGGIFGQDAGAGSSSSANIVANYCYSKGIIGQDGGGIFGLYAGQLSSAHIEANNCYSIGSIASRGGGIFGGYTGYSSSAHIEANNCYSIGSIGLFGGGIFGYSAGQLSSAKISANNCYSKSKSIASRGGGIFGSYAGRSSSSNIKANDCYSIGNILKYGGGIFGANTGESHKGSLSIEANNCYSSGPIGQYCGGIIGSYAGKSANNSSIISTTNCYSGGNIAQWGGGIIGSNAGESSEGFSIISVNNCYSIGIIASYGGGIFGTNAGTGSSASIEANNCYSIGSIAGCGGGIFGSNAGSSAKNSVIISANNCYSNGSIAGGAGAGGGGIFGWQTGSNAVGLATISANNCYSIGSIASNSGGIFGQSAGFNAKDSVKINANYCYTIGKITTTDTGIYGSIAASLCKITDSSGSGTTNSAAKWSNDTANSTINKYTTIPVPNIWFSYDSSKSWLLSVFNNTLYNPNSTTLDFGNNGTSSSGLYTPGYTYSIIPGTASGTASGIIINPSEGKLNFSSTIPAGTYNINVLTGKKKLKTNYYYGYYANTYAANTYTLTVNPPKTLF